jgi:hypothetical protein
MLAVSANPSVVLPMLSVQREQCVMDNSARLFASMTKLALSMKYVMTVFVNHCVAETVIATARKFAKELLVRWDVDQVQTAQIIKPASTINVLIHAVHQARPVVQMLYALYQATRLFVAAQQDSLETQPRPAHTRSKPAPETEDVPRDSNVLVAYVQPSVPPPMTTACSMKSVLAVSVVPCATVMLTASVDSFARNVSVLLAAKLMINARKTKHAPISNVKIHVRIQTVVNVLNVV